jgi:hypothetical protein
MCTVVSAGVNRAPYPVSSNPMTAASPGTPSPRSRSAANLPVVLPEIEQDVVRVTHAGIAADLQRRGADVERAVLSRAVLWHSQDRVIRDGNHTIVFA